ncbi:MAG TPA: hypothetical protein VMF35_16000 [Acidimicrobiales bacterium]|nr:hypothetical protein [Acidimicrobiales bacterium]
MPHQKHGEEASSAERARAGELLEILEEFSCSVDDLWVQLALLKDDVLESLPQHLDLARQVNRAAAPKLQTAFRDALENAKVLREGADQFLHDMKQAFDAIEGAIPHT